MDGYGAEDELFVPKSNCLSSMVEESLDTVIDIWDTSTYEAIPNFILKFM